MNHPPPDWTRWFSWKIAQADFERRREPHLRFERYNFNFDDMAERIAMITTDLPKYVSKARPGGLMTSTRRRLWDVLDWLSIQYSAGAPVTQLAEVWPYALVWAEEYAGFHDAYHQTPEAGNYVTPHVTLRDEEYWIVALRLVCLGLLTGHGRELPRVMKFLDYANEDMGVRDGLLERLVALFVPGRGAPPDKATRHLPYRKLFKVFDAPAQRRPGLMVKYLDEWYHASRREPYIDKHGESDMGFYGYWSWEAAATTWVLGIDDSTYRDKPFYPRDMADYGKSLGGPPRMDLPDSPRPETRLLIDPEKTRAEQQALDDLLNNPQGVRGPKR